VAVLQQAQQKTEALYMSGEDANVQEIRPVLGQNLDTKNGSPTEEDDHARN
jgi:hypothetical protein